MAMGNSEGTGLIHSANGRSVHRTTRAQTPHKSGLYEIVASHMKSCLELAKRHIGANM